MRTFGRVCIAVVVAVVVEVCSRKVLEGFEMRFNFLYRVRLGTSH
jgi:hypothetical protein